LVTPKYEASVPEVLRIKINFETGHLPNRENSSIFNHEKRGSNLTEMHLEKILNIVITHIKSGWDVNKIRKEFEPLFGLSIVDQALVIAKHRLDRTYTLDDPRVIIRQGDRKNTFKWYGGPHEHSERWLFAKSKLEREGRSQVEIDEVSKSSTQILGLLSSPTSETFTSRGLVLGFVQSGKTTNFIATIAQAADEGYRLIIVLSGVTNNLRKQTQERLEKSLTGQNPKNWHWLTSLDSDFNASMNANDLLSHPGKVVIAVIKKNNSRLRRLKRWLESASVWVRQGLPVLIIDDEADQATVNSARIINRQTAINKTLTDMLKSDFLPKNAYLGYTATPFANILSDAKDQNQLFPRDFIYPLKRSHQYFGAEQLFGRDPINEDDQAVYSERDIIIPISQADRVALGTLIDPNSQIVPTDLPHSLKNAILWFVLATAARRFRSGKNRFSTMLIHTSGRIPCHVEMKKLVSSYLAHLLSLSEPDISTLFSNFWNLNCESGWIEGDLPILTWDEIKKDTINALNTCRLIVDNSKSEDRLSYDFENEDSSVPFIVIGGNTLARGLTLEGLICSYFMRTSTAYDSLLQMGRWFGYRVGYEDLQRIWMQDNLISDFRHMALVEEEIRQNIDELAREGLDPSQVPIRIRDHRVLTITAINKMNYAKLLQVGYSDTRVETILFEKNVEVILSNQAATRKLIDDIHHVNIDLTAKNSEGWPLFREVPWKIVRDYFQSYNWAEGATRANGDSIISYIDAHQGTGYMEFWNVFVYRVNKTNVPIFDLGNGVNTTAITRSALEHRLENSTVNIHHLVSSSDGSADIDLTKKQVTKLLQQQSSKISDAALRKLRESRPESNKRGLLGIYVVDAQSKAQISSNGRRARREDLNLEAHPIGLGIFFGSAKISSANVTYYGPDLDDFITTDIDDDYLDNADQDDDLGAA
jgi:hypothetical protein